MTDLRSRVVPTAAPTVSRPTVIAAVGAVLAAGAGLVLCVGTAVLGWLAGDGGGVADAARAGADAWLLAHGAGLSVGSTSITAIPLGLSALLALLVWWTARRVAEAADLDERRSVLVVTATLAGCYAAVATVVAVVSATEAVAASPARALVGSLLLAGVSGGLGLGSTVADPLVGPDRAGRPPGVPARLTDGPTDGPTDGLAEGLLPAVARGSAAVVALLLASGALLTTVSLVTDFEQATTVAASLEAGALGAAVFTVAQVLLLPNAALFGVAYLLGPGFSFGADTVVAPSGVTLGQVPAVPLLVALPSEGTTPWWAMALLATPVLAGMVGAVVALRVSPTDSLVGGMSRGAAVGVVGGASAGLLTALAGGAVGPGRLADVGAPAWQCAGAGALAAGLGGFVAGIVHVWWTRR